MKKLKAREKARLTLVVEYDGRELSSVFEPVAELVETARGSGTVVSAKLDLPAGTYDVGE